MCYVCYIFDGSVDIVKPSNTKKGGVGVESGPEDVSVEGLEALGTIGMTFEII